MSAEGTCAGGEGMRQSAGDKTRPKSKCQGTRFGHLAMARISCGVTTDARLDWALCGRCDRCDRCDSAERRPVGSAIGSAVSAAMSALPLGQTRLSKVDSRRNPARRMPPGVSRRGGDGRRCMHGCAWSLSHVSVWAAAVAVAIAPCTSVTTHGQVPSSGLRLRGGMPRDIDGKGGKEMHKWVMQQVRQPYRLCIRFRGRRAGALAAFDTFTRRRRRRWATRCCRKKSPRYMSRRSERRWRIRSWRPHTPSSSR